MNKLVNIRTYTIGFVGPCGRTFADLTDMVSARGNIFVRMTSLISLSAGVVGAKPKIDRLFVDVDGLGGIESIIDDLLDLRRYLPKLPVVLISSEFSRDEFDLTRVSICDCSLKAPLTCESVDYAITQSRMNNMVWVKKNFESLEHVEPNSDDGAFDLHLFACIGVATVAGMLAGLICLLETRSWLYATGAYIIAGQVSIWSLILLTVAKAKSALNLRQDVKTRSTFLGAKK
ncbi:hypothetical protein [Phaeobacter gallaeciensis]|uniref:hypothetical protein n=1 Tax=Phaeobacter gallaeciensis TaxID=60890 RepID=UPI00237F09B0|nr:hypothetical protein [Phaeobacter gallaeciensis]MDE4142948.1 hypothetical protein [Phaeobacter gallaeciensis]MDE4155626.1 hypothetical protein [Phaeobacter gallaeciensis]MDE4260065.1 hypothetical protein [Phaeobacter gallaeciensis]MDE4264287.1 hypothetical protein [Phaeobacter gallaeciensis]MDE4272650.1 hypothetical protein [Phaeobacter gallaeciensis]